MSEGNAAIEVKSNYDHLVAEEKNKHTVYCTKCPSKILSSTMGKYTTIEVIFYHVNNFIELCIYSFSTIFFF